MTATSSLSSSSPYASTPTDQRRELVEAHAALVRRVVRRLYRRLPPYARGFEEEDLLSVGIMGLLDARERYDPSSGTSFETFAEFRIKGAVLDEIRRHDFFPRRLRAKANALARAERALEEELGRPPREEEVAARLEMSLDELAALRDEVAPYSFVEADHATPIQGRRPSPEKIVAARQVHERVRALIEQLPEREQLILDLYFTRELTLAQIGQLLDYSAGRISQLKSRALTTLREQLRAELT